MSADSGSKTASHDRAIAMEHYTCGTKCVNCERRHDHEIAIVLENNRAMSRHKEDIGHLLRIISFIGFVTKTPKGRVQDVRDFFKDDLVFSYGEKAHLAPALLEVYNFFEGIASDQKLVVMILWGSPSDIQDAISEHTKLLVNGVTSLVLTFNDHEDNYLLKLSSYGKVINLVVGSEGDEGWNSRSEASSHVVQAMLRKSCMSDDR
ncbi:hypothetical protein KIN20_004992 [Parelaphostrongylus tenuis]|uniref:Uncharacterized protein n=1 Tax=Parelaphostrongylus tenuis TaxID=148309 RepID=A0AAD5QJQ5_PARTN|nr:hypothetical protein KIN20_004992 [Parelaphostrongylus tenuis]